MKGTFSLNKENKKLREIKENPIGKKKQQHGAMGNADRLQGMHSNWLLVECQSIQSVRLRQLRVTCAFANGSAE
jgi:hypothetical protein